MRFASVKMPYPLSRRVPQEVWDNIIGFMPYDRHASSPTADCIRPLARHMHILNGLFCARTIGWRVTLCGRNGGANRVRLNDRWSRDTAIYLARQGFAPTRQQLRWHIWLDVPDEMTVPRQLNSIGVLSGLRASFQYTQIETWMW